MLARWVRWGSEDKSPQRCRVVTETVSADCGHELKQGPTARAKSLPASGETLTRMRFWGSQKSTLELLREFIRQKAVGVFGGGVSFEKLEEKSCSLSKTTLPSI